MSLKATYFDDETHANETDGWDELIGKKWLDWGKVLGEDFTILSQEDNDLGHGVHVIVKDEQDHILEIWTNGELVTVRVAVYNPIFTIEGT